MTDDNAVPPAPSPAPSPRQSNFNADGELDARAPLQAVASALESAESKPVRCAKFRQQELWAWKPVWSPTVIVIMYALVAVIFIPLGIVLFVQTSRMFSSPLRRYDGGSCQVGNETTADTPAKQCMIRLSIDKNVTAPSYFYYGITNYYQNARTYVSSRDDQQLRGNTNTSSDTCDPLRTNAAGEDLNPCGLIANSVFNDTFTLCKDQSCSQPVTLNSTGIAWDVDKETRFMSSFSEDFMVWMRVAAYRNWKKLYRIIEDDLPVGEYWIHIDSKYPVSGFDGKKFFFISETSWFGGPNLPLAISYIVVGCVGLLVAIFFGIRSRMVQPMELPPTTSVYLEGLVKNPIEPNELSSSLQSPTV